MLTILRMVASKAGWLLLSFVLIIAVLVAKDELPAKLLDWRTQADNAEHAATYLKKSFPVFKQRAEDAVLAADSEITTLRRASAVQLGRAKDDIVTRQNEARARVLSESDILWAAATGKGKKISDSLEAQYVDLPLLNRAAALIELRCANLRDLAKQYARDGSLKRDEEKFRGNVNAFNVRVKERNRRLTAAAAQLRYPICRRAAEWLGCDLVRDLRKRDRELLRDRQALHTEAETLQSKKKAVRKLKLLKEQVAEGVVIVASAIENYRLEAQRLSDKAGGYAFNKGKSALLRYGFQTVGLILGAVLLPILHRLFVFLAIAPHAARARPVSLRPPGPQLMASKSGISVEVTIGPDSELLLRSGLQSITTDIRGDDKFVLDWNMPFTCIAAGLVNLQRLRSDRFAHVVVSATQVEYRVVAIEVPAGGAVVVHPRALQGLVKSRGQRLVITRPWRIFWLISWITAQFRYVVFHGPCTLILQGCGDVRIEDAARGRMIDRRLTLGFDAGVAYGAVRSASFMPYLRGQASLFNDNFNGSGHYLYEQRAPGSGKVSLLVRGLTGVRDTVLNALGI